MAACALRSSRWGALYVCDLHCVSAVQSDKLMYVKVKGGHTLEVRTERSVKVTAGLAMTADEFYASQETFVANVAATLGIPPSRIRVANVVAGRRLLDADAESIQVRNPHHRVLGENQHLNAGERAKPEQH